MPLPMPKLKKSEDNIRIGLIGTMGTGKTYLANHLVNNHNFTKIALADKLKAIAYEMFGVKGKDGEDRLILQGIGSDFRKYDPDVWLKYYLNVVQIREQYGFKRVVTDDVRYLNEAAALKKNGFILIRVAASPEIVKARLDALYPNRPAEASVHASETEQEAIKADYLVENNDVNGPLDLAEYLKLL
jgi:predicted kinase